jgi:hypothetical protein
MSTLTFNTYHFVERLEKAGMPREQAAAFAEAQRESLAEAMDSGLVTRSDLVEVKTELKADVARLDSKIDLLRAESSGESKLIRWMVGLSLALSTGIIALLAKLFIAFPH